MMLFVSAQFNARTARSPSVNGQGSPPKGLISQRPAFSLSSGLLFGCGREEINAINWPSGDHFALLHPPVPRVSWTSLLPARLDRNRWLTHSFLSLSGTLFTQIAQRQSGETLKSEAHSAERTSSMGQVALDVAPVKVSPTADPVTLQISGMKSHKISGFRRMVSFVIELPTSAFNTQTPPLRDLYWPQAV